MGWITSRGCTIQDDNPNEVVTRTNQLYWDDKYNVLYLVPRNLVTDNYTIPFGINKSKWDIRPSHLHDIGCKYHKLIVVDLPIYTIVDKYLYSSDGNIYCKDIPIEYLKVVSIKYNDNNNLFYRAMIDCNINKFSSSIYRIGVQFNIGWFLNKPPTINLSKIYKEELDT